MANLFSLFHFFLAQNRNKATVLIIIALNYAFIEIWPKLMKQATVEVLLCYINRVGIER